METPQPLPVVLAFATLLEGLLEAIGARYGVFPIRGPLMRFLWRRFSRAVGRFARLATRVAAGKAVSDRPSRPGGARAANKPRTEPGFRLRSWVAPKYGWLCRIASDSTGASAFARALHMMLTTDPDMLALLAATPATARGLAPICFMLGIPAPKPPARAAATQGAPLLEPAPDSNAAPPGAVSVNPRTRFAPPPRPAAGPPDPPGRCCTGTVLRAA